jgi:hypothetical protein
MLEKLLEKLRPWAEAMEGADDPRGDVLLMLETRVSRLEDEIARLCGPERGDQSNVAFGSERPG